MWKSSKDKISQGKRFLNASNMRNKISKLTCFVFTCILALLIRDHSVNNAKLQTYAWLVFIYVYSQIL